MIYQQIFILFQDLNHYFQTIVGQMYMRGQLGRCFGMQSRLMTHMDEVGVAGTHGTSKLNSIINRLVRAMRVGAQAVDYKCLYSLQSMVGLLGSCEHIGHKS